MTDDELIRRGRDVAAHIREMVSPSDRDDGNHDWYAAGVMDELVRELARLRAVEAAGEELADALATYLDPTDAAGNPLMHADRYVGKEDRADRLAAARDAWEAARRDDGEVCT